MINEKYRKQWKAISKNSYGPAPVVGSLRARRNKAGLGLRELAILCDVSHSHLCNVEKGVRGVSSEMAERISYGLTLVGVK